MAKKCNKHFYNQCELYGSSATITTKNPTKRKWTHSWILFCFTDTSLIKFIPFSMVLLGTLYVRYVILTITEDRHVWKWQVCQLHIAIALCYIQCVMPYFIAWSLHTLYHCQNDKYIVPQCVLHKQGSWKIDGLFTNSFLLFDTLHRAGLMAISCHNL